MIIKKSNGLNGNIKIPGDKSISHRAIILGAIADGTTIINGFLNSDDCISTINCFKKLGVEISKENDTVKVIGKGLHGLKAPDETLYTGNSGTTTRLLCGLLTGQNFDCILDGDSSIRKRPMKRVSDPLSLMGADIKCTDGSYCPIEIKGKHLHAIEYTLPVASAQLKSAIILAGLYADGTTKIIEPTPSRNHTELMLSAFGGNIKSNEKTIEIIGGQSLKATEINVPGDISSAAFFMVAALITPNSQILIKNVGINETRTGILDVLLDMGADITIVNIKTNGEEPVCDMIVESSELRGITIEGETIPALIDEIPVIAVAAAFASGTTVIKDAQELKVKESDRILSVCNMLKAVGVKVTPTEDGMIIEGGKNYNGGSFETGNDHRIAMSSAILALNCNGESEIKDYKCVDISYPEFFKTLERLNK